MPARSGTNTSDEFSDPSDPLFNRFKCTDPHLTQFPTEAMLIWVSSLESRDWQPGGVL